MSTSLYFWSFALMSASAVIGLVRQAMLQRQVVRDRARIRQLRATLRAIAAPLSCGCKPCRGQCRSAEALQADLDARIEAARETLALDRVVEPVSPPPRPAPPLAKCERPIPHAGLNAGHRSFMDRLVCRCEACAAWREATTPERRA